MIEMSFRAIGVGLALMGAATIAAAGAIVGVVGVTTAAGRAGLAALRRSR